MSQSSRSKGPTIVKKYANRRLYDTSRSSYVTLDDLYEMIKENHDFVVQDAKTNKDLTRSVLTQIIVEKETKGENMLPLGFLKQLIGFYGDNIQSLVPNYLEHSLDSFAKRQEELQETINKSIQSIFPVDTIEELSKRNMDIFERTLQMFTPFQGDNNIFTGVNTSKTPGQPNQQGETSKNKEQVAQEIKDTIAQLQEELKNLNG